MQQGVDKDLGTMPTIHLGGEDFTPSSLKAVFSDETAAMNATDAARAAAKQALAKEQTARLRTNQVLKMLRAFILAYFGPNAVAVFSDFGLAPPKSKATKTVAAKAVAVAKAKATREARGTKGPVAKLETVGTVNAAAIKSAINTPNATPPAGAGSSAPALPPAPAPAAPATAPAAPKAGSSSPSA